MSVFIKTNSNDFFSASFRQKTNCFNRAVRANSITGWGGAAVSIGACGASDPGANPGPDLSNFERFNKPLNFKVRGN